MIQKILILLLCCFPFIVEAQIEKNNSGNVLFFNFEFGMQTPGGDLKDRFGNSSGIGLSANYMLDPSNISFSVESSFLFGREVKEDVIRDLRNEDSLLIGNNRILADVRLRMRGFYLGIGVGKLFAISEKNKRSGIKVNLGLGLMQHKIRIQADPESFAPLLTGEYIKGYDRLSNGLSLREFVGYQHLSNNRLLNFYAGFEFTQAFTQSRRDYDIPTRQKDETKRTDLLWGFKVGWTLPFYVGENAEEIYY